MKSLVIFATKGGVGKSNTVFHFDRVLSKKYNTACVNLDVQDHTPTTEPTDSTEFLIFDTLGAWEQNTLELLESASQDESTTVVCVVRAGANSRAEYAFQIEALQRTGIKNAVFMFNEVNPRYTSYKEASEILQGLLADTGYRLLQTAVPALQAIDLKQPCARVDSIYTAVINEIYQEVIL